MEDKMLNSMDNYEKHINNQDVNVKQFCQYLASTSVAVQATTKIMKNTFYELLCDKECRTH